MASNYGVIPNIRAPVLREVTQPALIRFETAYAAYKEKCSDVNHNRSEEDQMAIASVRDCIESSTLHALCIMGEIENASTVEEATAEKVQTWFDNALAAAPKDLSECIEAALASVTYSVCEQDPGGAVTTLVINLIKALDQQNASSILNDKDKAKFMINKLEGKLEPPLLRDRVRMRRALWNTEEKSDIKFFGKEVSALAVEVSKNEIARSRMSTVGKRHRAEQVKKTGKPLKSRRLSGDTKESLSPHSGKNSPYSSHKHANAKEWSEKCLNPEYNEIHRVKNCPITSVEDRKRLLDQYFKTKKAAKAVKKAGIASVHSGDGRYRLLIEDKVRSVALGDYGADCSALPQSLFQQIMHADPNLPVTVFEKPIALKGAFNVEGDYSASKSILLSITILLPGSNVPVRIRGVTFYVVDEEMEEVLLGRPFLMAIGFNLDEHLERVRNHVHDKDLSEIDCNQLKIATAKYYGLSYQDGDDDPIPLPEALAAGIGTDSNASIDEAFRAILENAKKNGISDEGHHRLAAILKQHKNAFRIKLGPDPPAKVPSLVITPAANAQPFRSPQRRYAPQQRDFIIQTIRELESVGAIYKNPAARWASPAFAVLKPGSTKLRFTVDLPGLNAQTVPIQSAMPHLESKLQDVPGSTCFANIDLAHGYWQVPLSKESQEFMSIQTPLGVYSSRRLLHGGSDSGNHFQAVLHDKFDGRVKKMFQWLDDFLFYAKNEKELLDNLETFLTVCLEVGIKVHAKKSFLFNKEVHFCGRIVSGNGVQYHPRHFDSLLNMKKPTSADELQQLLCATNWMRNSIPAYAELVAPLHSLMEKSYVKAGKRTKQAVRRISLTNSWGADHDAAFDSVKKQLAASVKLAHPKAEHDMCLFTDASDTHWAAVLTQVPRSQRRRDIEQQDHSPLCFLSGAFSGSSANWSVPEKEGFAIVEAMCRLDYLVVGHEISIFTDHANLVYLYDPYGKNPGISRHTASKLMRWAIKLSAFRYVIEHLPGDRNVWADMLTRWAVQSKTVVNSKRVPRLKSLLLAPINPGVDPKLDWPSLKDIIQAQENAPTKPGTEFRKSDNGWTNGRGVHWIPKNDSLLQLRILIAAHTGIGSHRSWRVTRATVEAHFYWNNMDKDVETFVQSCLHCLCRQTGTIVPRSMGHALHADRPNELLHFDFCYMSSGEDGNCYVLILKHDHSGYVWLKETSETTAESTAEVLIQWFAAFGVVKQWVSDRGSHFKNELIRILRQPLKSSHHFTLGYCPWSNGSVEVVCRELVRATRALLSEFQLPQICWPSVLQIVQSTLKHSVLDRLGKRCPLTAFTGLFHDTPLTSIKHRHRNSVRVSNIGEVRVRQVLRIQEIQNSLESMHRDVAIHSSRKRQQAVDAHNEKTNVRTVNFSEGDNVLRGVLQRERGRKPSLQWRGPYCVAECRSEYIFLMEDLMNGKREEVHGRRLRMFCNKYFEVNEELRNHLAYQVGELLVTDRFHDIRRISGTVQLLVKWKGFSEEETNWVDLSSLRNDVPVLVEEYVQEVSKEGITRQRAVVTSI